MQFCLHVLYTYTHIAGVDIGAFVFVHVQIVMENKAALRTGLPLHVCIVHYKRIDTY